MNICVMVVNTVRILVRTVIQIVREVVTTVCKWVTTVITTIKEVAKKVCSWLPWPLDKICNWVTELIEVVETVVEWVCEEVIERIFDWIEVILEYLIYILTWICWVVSWPFRFIDLVFCWIGIKPKKFIHICVKILTDEKDNPAMPVADVRALIEETQHRFDQCNISLCVLGFELVRKPEHLTGVECGIGGLFSSAHIWFAKNRCIGGVGSSIVPITIYVIRNVNPGKGCAIPGNHYIIIDEDTSDATPAHEIGHLADLWLHSDDPKNVMYSPSSDDSVKLTKNQCCMIRSSRYATLTSFFGCSRAHQLGRVLTGSSSSCVD